jgi:anthranilate phosphoribosyltransferase
MPAPDLSWPALLSALARRDNLTADETSWAMSEIFAGEATPAQLAAFIVLLRAKGETPEEFSGLVATMLERATPVSVSGRCVDVVGTGGDRSHSVNISTMSALVAAGAGRQVVKHGNRAATSSCGTADVLEALGVAIDLPAEGVAMTVAEIGIGFCFAPVFHSGMRHAGGVRREVGIPTAFNFLGPMTNPARPKAGAIGCADVAMAPVMAKVFADRGDTVVLFRGNDGLDEITTASTSQVWLVNEGEVRSDVLDPAEFGIKPPEPDALRGKDAPYNAEVVRRLLNGETGAVRDAVLLNAAAAIAAFDGVVGSASEAIAHGLPIATEAVDTGRARDLLASWVEVSQRVKAG